MTMRLHASKKQRGDIFKKLVEKHTSTETKSTFATLLIPKTTIIQKNMTI